MRVPMLLARARSLQARLLPHGLLDVVRQVLLFAAAYYAYRLVRGMDRRPAGRDGGLRQRAPPDPHRADAGLLRRAQRAGVGLDEAGDHRLRQLDLPQLPDLGDPRRARLPLPLPQQELLLRAQHVHGRHGHRARRLHRAARPRRRASSRSGASWTPSRTSPASATTRVAVNALFNPYAAVPSMHVCFALHDRLTAGAAVQAPRDAHRLGACTRCS